MGFYRQQILPHVVDRVCGMSGLRRWRAEASAGLSGTLVEIGFGSGLNVQFYPPEVDQVFAVEPSARAFRIARKRIDGSRTPIERIGLDGQSIPLPDQCCDVALCTFALCTIPDPDAALEEVRRVLRPRGRFHFLEHGIAPEPGVAAWQRRIEPLQRRLADGCHLTRDPVSMVRNAGFVLDEVSQSYGQGPRPWNYFTRAASHTSG
ncbi:MAG: class I SAM-dependent methyltransferase [Acidimicrobiales bacterium]|jgi:ubiquinone/menaquinone biosynthesis C-methylase UbiE